MYLVTISVVSLIAWDTVAEESVQACEVLEDPSLLEISMLTMPPGGELWSIFGHTALWVRSPVGERVYNFGVISPEHPDLTRRFVTGELDFFLGTRSYESMMAYYRGQHRRVYRQRLDIPYEAAVELARFLEREAAPENRTYRYHWIDANCSTRVRDALDQVLGGLLSGHFVGHVDYTPRQEVLRHLAQSPAAWFGWNFTVGSADEPLTRWDSLFLPDRLYTALEEVELGEGHPLVSDTCLLLDGTHGWAPPKPPNWDFVLWLLGFAFAAILWTLLRVGRQRPLARVLAGSAIVLFGTIGGALGAASVWTWSQSTYSGFSDNANLFLANPLSFALLPIGVAVCLGWRRDSRFARLASFALLSLGAVGLIASLTPLSNQEGFGFLGLFLPALVVVAKNATKRDQMKQIKGDFH